MFRTFHINCRIATVARRRQSGRAWLCAIASRVQQRDFLSAHALVDLWMDGMMSLSAYCHMHNICNHAALDLRLR